MITLSNNRYTTRREIRDGVNLIADLGFKKAKEIDMNPLFRVDLHICDQLHDRGFPVKEFFEVLMALATTHETELMDIAAKATQGEDGLPIPIRVNCYSHGNYMIGITVRRYADTNAIHIDVRTCYQERNMQNREREIPVEKIWTRGVPYWMKNYV